MNNKTDIYFLSLDAKIKNLLLKREEHEELKNLVREIKTRISNEFINLQKENVIK